MRPSIRCSACLAAFVLAVLQPAVAAPADDFAIAQSAEIITSDQDDADLVYPLAILAAAGWDRVRVNEAVQQVERIFGQCGIAVTAGETYWLDAPDAFHVLDDTMESQLLAELPGRRPIVLLVDRTVYRDLAYAYLMATPSERGGTAWITRTIHPACLGRLIAHELGHILLDSADHSHDRNNLMHHACSVSNISGSPAGTKLTQSQCDVIRTWD